MRRLSAVFVLTFVVAAVACGPKYNPGGATTQRRERDRSIIDSTELRGGNFSTVYDAVSALHQDWLLPRGGPQGQRAPELGVWIEGQTRARPVDFLRDVRPADIRQVRRLSTTESLHTYSWPWGGLVLTLR